MPIFEPHQFSILGVENLRLHYSATSRQWLRRYEGAVATVRRRFGERFVRMRRLYLAGSIAAFDTGWLQLFPIAFSRPDADGAPQTREHLYALDATTLNTVPLGMDHLLQEYRD